MIGYQIDHRKISLSQGTEAVRLSVEAEKFMTLSIIVVSGYHTGRCTLILFSCAPSISG